MLLLPIARLRAFSSRYKGKNKVFQPQCLSHSALSTLFFLIKIVLLFVPTKRPQARCFLEGMMHNHRHGTIERRGQCREDFSENFSFFIPFRRTKVRRGVKTEKEKQNQILLEEKRSFSTAVFAAQCIGYAVAYTKRFCFSFLQKYLGTVNCPSCGRQPSHPHPR